MRTKTTVLLALLALAAIPLFLYTSCNKTKKLAAFDVTYDLPKVYFTYSSTLQLKSEEVILHIGQAKIALDSILKVHDIPSGIIGSATFSHFAITITDPPDATFSWLQSARALASANASFNPNAELANVVNNDPAAKTINMTLNNVELTQYMNNTTFYYQILGTLNGTLPSNIVAMFLDSQLKLHIEPL